MGDVFDSRKSIDYQSLEWAKRVVFDPLKKYKVHAITGNHDCYYKNTNEVNSPELLLTDYPNIKTYSSPKTIKIGGLNILMLPWICTENYDESLSHIKKSKAKVVMGHLEINGFRATRGHMMETGMDVKVFNKFDKVYSGHFHTRSEDGKIFYLGNPYQLYWNDVNDIRGFHFFDTETLEWEFVENPYSIFEHVYYEDTNVDLFNALPYANKIVKIIVRKKTDQHQFERFVDKFQKAGVYDLKIVENLGINDLEVDFEGEKIEDTVTLLDKYVDDSDFELDKARVKELLREVYQEACELE